VPEQLVAQPAQFALHLLEIGRRDNVRSGAGALNHQDRLVTLLDLIDETRRILA
jgi:hypothetical protein